MPTTEAVVFADTVDTFENRPRLDKFWQDQADICTGSRSQVNVILD